jgi:hypothetical protein
MSDKLRSKASPICAIRDLSQKTARLQMNPRLALWVSFIDNEVEWFSFRPGTLLAKCSECDRPTHIVIHDGVWFYLFCSFCVEVITDGRTVSQNAAGLAECVTSSDRYSLA